MRTSVLAATLTGALGVTALDKSLDNAFSFLRRSGCGELDGCGKWGKGSYVPDAKTFILPDKGYEHGNRWELINKHPRHGHHHHHHDLHSYVNFDFREESLIFEFEKIEEHGHVKTKEKLRYEEIEIKIAVENAHFDNAHRYSLKDGHCRDYDGRYRCHLPYRDLVHGGHKGMCPHKDKEGKSLFVKIDTVVVAGEERVELCNRGVKEREYFRLHYACTECKYEEYEKDCHRKPHHHHHHGKHHHHHDHHKHHGHHVDKYHHDGKHHHHDHHKHHGHHVDKYQHEGKHHHHDKPHHCHKHDCHHHHHDKPHHCHKHDCHHNHHHEHKPKHHCHHCHKPKHDCGCKKNHHNHHHSPRDLDVECAGTFLEAYGTGKYSHHLKEIGCGHDGYFHRYPKKELEVSVYGDIELGGYSFGHFKVRLDKSHEDVLLVIDVDVKNPQYRVTEIAAIIVCEDGLHKKDKDICKPSSYPYRHHDKHGLDNYHFNIVDEFKCKGDYFIAVYVLVCVAEDKCQYKKVGQRY